jgi:predicted RNase H-like HicB family nuclease
MTEYTAILERGGASWSAYVPDLPGCVAAAETREETVRLIREAVALHIELMREGGEDVPPPVSEATTVPLEDTGGG